MAALVRRMLGVADDKASKPPSGHKDKLAETKRAERERKDVHKAELAAAKSAKAAAVKEAKTLHKAERAAAHAGTARERADERGAARHTAHADKAAAAALCEHGVAHCKVCCGRGSGREGGKSRWVRGG